MNRVRSLKPVLLVCALLGALTLAIYWPAGKFDFVFYDDPQFTFENPEVTQGLSWQSLIYALTQPVVGNWHPVTTLSHILAWEFWGDNAGAHHLVNILIHTANAMLLFFALRTLTGRHWPSAVVAALFALHPLRLESVAWIAERKDVLSGFFFLLTLWAYAGYAASRKETNRAKANVRRNPTLYYGAALVCFALGLMSKPMLVTVPFVLLLLDYWPLDRLRGASFRSIGPLLLEKTPFFLLSAVCSWITLQVQKSAGAMNFFRVLSWEDRLANSVVSYVRYLGKMVWPEKLSIIYPHPASGYYLSEDWAAWQVGAAGLLLLAITALVLVLARRKPYLAVGWFWFLGTSVPIIGLVQVGEQAMADRYTYITLIGPVWSLVWLWADWAGTQPRQRKVAAAGAIAALIAFSWLTHLQLRHWRDTVSLFEHAIEVTADNPSAHFALGVGLERQGQTNQALTHYRVSIGIDPQYVKAHYNLGQLFRKQGRWAEAARHYEQVIRSQPNDLAANLNLASVLARLGRYAEAARYFSQALRLDPNSLEGLNNLAWLLATCPAPEVRDGPRAVQLAEHASRLQDPPPVFILGTLAAAYAEAGRFEDAVQTAERACSLAAQSGNEALLAKNRELLEMYRRKQPYREQT